MQFRGFILQPTYRIEAGRPVVHLYGRLESGGTFLVRDWRQVARFFVRESDAALSRALGAVPLAATGKVTLSGEPVLEVEVPTPADTPRLRDRLLAAGIPCYEADVRFAMRYLIERGIRGSLEIRGEPRRSTGGAADVSVRVDADGNVRQNADGNVHGDAGFQDSVPGGIDLVFDEPDLAPADWTPSLTVLSFDIETDPSARRLLAISLHGCGASEVLLWTPAGMTSPREALAFSSEEELLRAFCRRVREIDPDVLCGWNVIDFDLTVLSRIAAARGVPLELGRGSGTLRLQPQPARSVWASSQASIPGRVVLDGINLLRGAFIRMEDYSLDAVAREVLGEGKTISGPGRAGEILRLFREDREALVQYSLTDARLVLEILERLRLVQLSVERSLLTGMPPDRVSASIASFDFLYLSALSRLGVVAPSVRTAAAERASTQEDRQLPWTGSAGLFARGGGERETVASVGEASASREEGSSRRAAGASGDVEAGIGEGEEGSGDEEAEVDEREGGSGEGKVADASASLGSDLAAWEPTAGGYVLEPEPGLYRNVLVFDFKSLYPSLIRTFNIDPLRFVRARAAGSQEGGTLPVRTAAAVAAAGAGEVAPSKPQDPIVAPNGAAFTREPGILPAMLDDLFPRREAARKAGDAVASNAIKILMNSFYGVLATPACRFHNPAIANAITGFGREMLLWSKRRIESYGYRVLYGDTDSLFVLSGTEDSARASEIARILVADLNRDIAEHVRATWDVDSRLELEFERLYLRHLLPPVRHGTSGARKRYAGLVEEDGALRVVFTGMEVVRRDWTDLARQVQRELYERLFSDRPVEDYLRSVVADLRAGLFDHLLVYRKALRKGLQDYTLGTPPHVAAARKMTGAPGRLIAYLITSAGPEPAGEARSPIDHEHYVQKQIRPVAEPVLVLLGADFDRVVGDDRQMELF